MFGDHLRTLVSRGYEPEAYFFLRVEEGGGLCIWVALLDKGEMYDSRQEKFQNNKRSLLFLKVQRKGSKKNKLLKCELVGWWCKQNIGEGWEVI